MGICFYWKCHYGDPAVEEAIRDDPSEQQYVWGLDHDSVSVSGLSKFFSERYEDIHEYFTETVALRCWRFDRLYVEFEAEEFTGATLVMRKWMQDIVSAGEFQSIKDKVRAFAERHPKQWDRIDGLCGSHRNTIVATPAPPATRDLAESNAPSFTASCRDSLPTTVLPSITFPSLQATGPRSSRHVATPMPLPHVRVLESRDEVLAVQPCLPASPPEILA